MAPERGAKPQRTEDLKIGQKKWCARGNNFLRQYRTREYSRVRASRARVVIFFDKKKEQRLSISF